MACKQIKEALFPRHQGAKPPHDELPSLIPLSSGLLAGRAWGDGRTAAHRNQHGTQRELAAPTTRRMSNLAQLQEKISLKRRFMRWASRAMKSSSTGMILRLLRSG